MTIKAKMPFLRLVIMAVYATCKTLKEMGNAYLIGNSLKCFVPLEADTSSKVVAKKSLLKVILGMV